MNNIAEERLIRLKISAIEDIKKMGIELDFNNIDLKVSPRMTRTYGVCSRKKGSKVFTIKISKCYLEDGGDKNIKTTIINEYLHCLNGGFNHGARWQMFARKFDVLGYNITRLSTHEGLKERKPMKALYKTICSECEKVTEAKRKFNVDKYRSACCHSTLILTDTRESNDGNGYHLYCNCSDGFDMSSDYKLISGRCPHCQKNLGCIEY